jgi:hypothetical protein
LRTGHPTLADISSTLRPSFSAIPGNLGDELASFCRELAPRLPKRAENWRGVTRLMLSGCR